MARKAGLGVSPGPTIRINQDGRLKVTRPDFLVTNPKTKQRAIVEVGRKNGTAHKRHQANIARKAGVDNYNQVDAEDLRGFNICLAWIIRLLRWK